MIGAQSVVSASEVETVDGINYSHLLGDMWAISPNSGYNRHAGSGGRQFGVGNTNEHNTGMGQMQLGTF